MREYHIKSLADLEKFAYRFAHSLSGGDIVALEGPLASGKTTLVQAVAKTLGAKTLPTSPTFVFLKVYSACQKRQGIKYLCHADMYRLKKDEKLPALDDYLGEKTTVCLIEWAEKIKDILPNDTVWLKIKILPDGSRQIFTP